MSRQLGEVVFVEGVRTPLGKAGPKGWAPARRAERRPAFWLGGISAHLDRSGVSEAVTGRRFLPRGVASLPA
jgi:hypothetical protein